MIKFYVNRELSQRLQIRLSRWKRWSREFLPPDPLGGLRSGYARQYTLDQAFMVFLGGHLVAGMHFSVPEAQRIIADLWPWLDQEGLPARRHAGLRKGVAEGGATPETMVFIYRRSTGPSTNLDFAYVARTRLADEAFTENGVQIRRVTYSETVLPSGSGRADGDGGRCFDELDSSVLYVTRLCGRFMRRVTGTGALGKERG